jgi:hypothetical protein
LPDPIAGGLIEHSTADRRQKRCVLQLDLEARPPGAEVLDGTIGNGHIEGDWGIGEMFREAAEQSGRGRFDRAGDWMGRFQIVYRGASLTLPACGASCPAGE